MEKEIGHVVVLLEFSSKNRCRGADVRMFLGRWFVVEMEGTDDGGEYHRSLLSIFVVTDRIQ